MITGALSYSYSKITNVVVVVVVIINRRNYQIIWSLSQLLFYLSLLSLPSHRFSVPPASSSLRVFAPLAFSPLLFTPFIFLPATFLFPQGAYCRRSRERRYGRRGASFWEGEAGKGGVKELDETDAKVSNRMMRQCLCCCSFRTT